MHTAKFRWQTSRITPGCLKATYGECALFQMQCFRPLFLCLRSNKFSLELWLYLVVVGDH